MGFLKRTYDKDIQAALNHCNEIANMGILEIAHEYERKKLAIERALREAKTHLELEQEQRNKRRKLR